MTYLRQSPTSLWHWRDLFWRTYPRAFSTCTNTLLKSSTETWQQRMCYWLCLLAKITDSGNSHIVNLQPGQLARTLSRLPGTLIYMPPEALEASSHYGPMQPWIFSFGHLALFVGLQVYKHSVYNVSPLLLLFYHIDFSGWSTST